jgi:N-glycosylase/DNA lyase
MYNKQNLKELKKIWLSKKPELDKRLLEFSTLRKNGNDTRIFPELVFCLFTPQSKAKTCWSAVETLLKKGLIFTGSKNDISDTIGKIGVRFKNNKAGYLLEARRLLDKSSSNTFKNRIEGFKSPLDARNWLEKNIKGLGFKEASHFLRNLGLGNDLAILDRHILKNLKLLGVIKEVPKSLNEKVYHDIEAKMKVFSKKTGIPMSHLDLILWYKEAGEIFK